MLSVMVHVPAGYSIDRAAREAIETAGQLGVGVRFDFNGASVAAYPNDTAGAVVQRYNEWVRQRAAHAEIEERANRPWWRRLLRLA